MATLRTSTTKRSIQSTTMRLVRRGPTAVSATCCTGAPEIVSGRLSFAMTTSNIVGLLIAALGGAAVGLERQWSGHAEGPGARFAGIRTFTMLGAVGGLSGWLWTAGVTAPAAILLAGAVAVVAAAYVAGSRHDIDGTTEIAALVVLAAGLLAGMGSIRLASGIVVDLRNRPAAAAAVDWHSRVGARRRSGRTVLRLALGNVNVTVNGVPASADELT